MEKTGKSLAFKICLLFTLITAAVAILLPVNFLLNGDNALYNILFDLGFYCFPAAVVGILTTIYAYVIFDTKIGQNGIPGKYKILMGLSYIPLWILIIYLYSYWYLGLLG